MLPISIDNMASCLKPQKKPPRHLSFPRLIYHSPMKFKYNLLVLFPLLMGLTPLLAQNKPFDPTGKDAELSLPRHVRTQVEYIELSLEDMTALMADPTATKNDTILRQRVTKLIKAQKAKIIESQMLIARSGEKATSESIYEYIYPTEYEPAELPNEIHIHNKDGDTKIPSKEIATGPTPTAFETRNVGSTLEVEPTIGENNHFVDIRLNPEIVYHVENIKWATWKDKHGEADIMMPIFYSLRVTTSATVVSGQPCLLAALSPKNDQGIADFSRKILVFVRCDIIVPSR